MAKYADRMHRSSPTYTFVFEPCHRFPIPIFCRGLRAEPPGKTKNRTRNSQKRETGQRKTDTLAKDNGSEFHLRIPSDCPSIRDNHKERAKAQFTPKEREGAGPAPGMYFPFAFPLSFYCVSLVCLSSPAAEGRRRQGSPTTTEALPGTGNEYICRSSAGAASAVAPLLPWPGLRTEKQLPSIHRQLHPHLRQPHASLLNMHRAGVPRLERGPNHGGPTPLILASRCGLCGSALPRARVYVDGEVDPMGSLR